MHDGYELRGGASSHNLASTGIPLAADASSISLTKPPTSVETTTSRAIPHLTYSTASSPPNSTPNRRTAGSIAQDQGHMGSV
jgi:hypothetical protein